MAPDSPNPATMRCPVEEIADFFVGDLGKIVIPAADSHEGFWCFAAQDMVDQMAKLLALEANREYDFELKEGRRCTRSGVSGEFSGEIRYSGSRDVSAALFRGAATVCP